MNVPGVGGGYSRRRTYVVEHGGPSFHRDTLEDGQHGVDDVVEADDAVFRSFPLGLARRVVTARVAAAEARGVGRARVLVLVHAEVYLICNVNRPIRSFN